MELHGKNLIAGERSAEGGHTFQAVDPRSRLPLSPVYTDATEGEVDRALQAAEGCFQDFRKRSAEDRATFLETVAEEVEALGGGLIERAIAETGLPEARLLGERGRTTGQLRAFAALVREGSWVEARIDTPLPDRTPLPKPDLRRMLQPIGPVVVFGASNFPLAFSAAGGDSASALAAGCPVVLKAHPGHPGTSEWVTEAFLTAARKTGMPKGLFSMVQGVNHSVSRNVVAHPLTQAVGFTGSLKAGRALYDLAASRPVPIPVYAEMGSLNPVFLLPGVLSTGLDSLVEGLLSSVTLGVGQFCTNPGLLVGIQGAPLDAFKRAFSAKVEGAAPGTMLHSGICAAYEAGVEQLAQTDGVECLAKSKSPTDPNKTQGGAAFFVTDAANFGSQPALSEEVFGPSTLLVECTTMEELEEVASQLSGHLTATLQGTEDDLANAGKLIAILERKVGRLLFGGFPTGVEVCPAMQHGGPYPATTDSRVTSVGTAAILRFARPVCYQSFPQSVLPLELRDKNERGIWRLVNNELTCADVTQ